MSEPTLEFWKNMALGLKDELVKRGDTIAELEAQAEELVIQSNMLFDRAAQRLARIKELEAENLQLHQRVAELLHGI